MAAFLFPVVRKLQLRVKLQLVVQFQFRVNVQLVDEFQLQQLLIEFREYVRRT